MVKYFDILGDSEEKYLGFLLDVASRSTPNVTVPKLQWLVDSLLLLRLNLTWDALAAISTEGVSETEHRRRFNVICDFIIQSDVLASTATGKPVSLRRYWNKVHSLFRSRVERRFAWWEKWRFTHRCDHGSSFVNRAFKLIVALESYSCLLLPRRYPNVADPMGILRFSGLETCTCDGSERNLVMGAYAWRKWYAERLWHDLRFIPEAKAPSKESPWRRPPPHLALTGDSGTDSDDSAGSDGMEVVESNDENS